MKKIFYSLVLFLFPLISFSAMNDNVYIETSSGKNITNKRGVITDKDVILTIDEEYSFINKVNIYRNGEEIVSNEEIDDTYTYIFDKIGDYEVVVDLINVKHNIVISKKYSFEIYTFDLDIERNYTNLVINWEEDDFYDGYKIYRKVEDGNYKLIKTINDSSITSYKDKGVKQNVKYSYKVRGYNKVRGSYEYGRYSNVVTSSVKIPSKVKELYSETEGKSIRLYFETNSLVDGYEIYRSTSKYGKLKLIKTIKDNDIDTYLDKDVSKENKYYYSMKSYKVINGKRIYSNLSDMTSCRLK